MSKRVPGKFSQLVLMQIEIEKLFRKQELLSCTYFSIQQFHFKKFI